MQIKKMDYIDNINQYLRKRKTLRNNIKPRKNNKPIIAQVCNKIQFKTLW